MERLSEHVAQKNAENVPWFSDEVGSKHVEQLHLRGSATTICEVEKEHVYLCSFIGMYINIPGLAKNQIPVCTCI